MRIVFMGTPAFAVPCLQALVEAGHEVCGVFTQPDKPKGRGYHLIAPPVKEYAITKNIPVFQPQKMRDGEALAQLEQLQPEIIVVVAYGKLLPPDILQLPPKGCVNVHASLLPKYRGAAPIQWSVLNGEKITGVTTMMMDEGLDTGDMLESEQTEIGAEETAGELQERLAPLGAKLLVRTLEKIQAGTAVRTKQEDSLSCYAPMLQKSLSPIDWNKPADAVHNLVRGLNPWPGASTVLEGKQLKIHRATLAQGSGAPGEVLSLDPFVVACGDQRALQLQEVQYEGKKRMPAQDFLRGHPVKLHSRLGEEKQ
ncbi:MAG TPA: methionyl-tRNA formyltransferase [Candidatus Gallacutalibacter stercoravium]|nr:methionyl-tRNA formyltransferase [Candidatus Gallacutalibacter stercoravium]